MHCGQTVLQNTFAAIEVDTDQVRDRFGGVVGLRVGQQCNYKCYYRN